MKLYYSDVLSPRKACAVARYLKSPVEFVFLDLTKGEHKTPAYLALNPNAKVPTLVDGERVIWEADAINCHLSERASAQLWPHDTEGQIDVLRWLSWNDQHFTRAGGGLYFEYIIKKRFRIGAVDAAVAAEDLANFRRFAAVLDAHLKGRDWLVGNQMTVADFAVAVFLPYAAEAQVSLDDFREVSRWHDQLNALDAWRNPFP